MSGMSDDDNPVLTTAAAFDLPPLFTVVSASRDAFWAARQLAAGGGEAGTLVVAEDREMLELAVVLEPDRRAADCFAALPVAMLALADALAAVGPPLKPVGFIWPHRLVLDGAEVGRARLALPKPAADPLPAWLVVGLELRLRFGAGADEPGRAPERTALAEEGFGEVTPSAIVEAFARHLLHWVHRWQEEGLGPATNHYGARLVEPKGEGVRFDPVTFDLLRIGPPQSREGLAERLLLGPAA
jgi:biotin-(acetyl-CoA carboxylase) ligase